MLKAIAKAFEFNESSISKKKLRFILVLMVVSLPTWPLIIMDYYNIFLDNWLGNAAAIMMLVGLISMICFICTRFVNRFYFPDKYLDEWEVRIKHKSMTFAFMCVVWSFGPIVFVLALIGDFSLNVTGEELVLWSFGFLLVLLYIQTFHALWQVRPIDEG